MKRAQVENTRRARAAPAGRAADMWPSYYNNKLLNKAIARMRWIDCGTSDTQAKVSRAVCFSLNGKFCSCAWLNLIGVNR